MPRWNGDARGRLERAALELFAEQGYDRTSVAQIAHRAELTESSFYRLFSDKREVLFAGDELAAAILGALEDVPVGAPAFPALLDACRAAAEVTRPRELLRIRSSLVASTPQLREREAVKLASLADALIAAVEARGESPRRARFAAELALAALREATERWLLDDDADLRSQLEASAADLVEVAQQAYATGFK